MTFHRFRIHPTSIHLYRNEKRIRETSYKINTAKFIKIDEFSKLMIIICHLPLWIYSLGKKNFAPSNLPPELWIVGYRYSEWLRLFIVCTNNRAYKVSLSGLKKSPLQRSAICDGLCRYLKRTSRWGPSQMIVICDGLQLQPDEIFKVISIGP